jgi:hypothetical protein
MVRRALKDVDLWRRFVAYLAHISAAEGVVAPNGGFQPPPFGAPYTPRSRIWRSIWRTFGATGRSAVRERCGRVG